MKPGDVGQKRLKMAKNSQIHLAVLTKWQKGKSGQGQNDKNGQKCPQTAKNGQISLELFWAK